MQTVWGQSKSLGLLVLLCGALDKRPSRQHQCLEDAARLHCQSHPHGPSGGGTNPFWAEMVHGSIWEVWKQRVAHVTYLKPCFEPPSCSAGNSVRSRRAKAVGKAYMCGERWQSVCRCFLCGGKTQLTQASEAAFTLHPAISLSISPGSRSVSLERTYAKICCKAVYFQLLLPLGKYSQNIEAKNNKKKKL